MSISSSPSSLSSTLSAERPVFTRSENLNQTRCEDLNMSENRLPASIWPPNMTDRGLLELQSSLRIAHTGRYSGLTIHCGDDVHHVHRVLVCLRSPVLAHICAQPETMANSNIIEIDCEPVAVQAMVDHIYFGFYPVKPIVIIQPEDRPDRADHLLRIPLIDAYVYELAEKFAITELKRQAVENFVSSMQDLEGYAHTYYFCALVRVIYSKTSDESRMFRDAIVDAVFRDLDCSKTPHFRSLIKDLPTFGHDLDLASNRLSGSWEGHRFREEVEVPVSPMPPFPDNPEGT